jgi:hypothetical protein
MPETPKTPAEQVKDLADFSGGMQATSTRFLRREKELQASENADYGEVGGVGKIKGYSQRASDLTSTTSTSTSTSTTTTSTSTSTSSSTSTSTTTTA